MGIFHDMTLPLSEYYIYSGSIGRDHLNIKIDSQLQLYEMNLKKGARSLEISIYS